LEIRNVNKLINDKPLIVSGKLFNKDDIEEYFNKKPIIAITDEKDLYFKDETLKLKSTSKKNH